MAEEKKVEKKAEPKPTPYKYEVVQPCHRDGLYYDPTNPKAELPMFHYAAEPQVSVALVPADEFTAKATAEQKVKFAEVARLNKLNANPELAALAASNARLEGQLADAIKALQAAATPKK